LLSTLAVVLPWTIPEANLSHATRHRDGRRATAANLRRGPTIHDYFQTKQPSQTEGTKRANFGTY
jgi:hypothetical protein